MRAQKYLADGEQNRSLSMRVVHEVADHLAVDVTDVGPLHETIDPDALDTLFQTPSPSNYDDRVTFPMEGCAVTVYGTGKVAVTTQRDASVSEYSGDRDDACAELADTRPEDDSQASQETVDD